MAAVVVNAIAAPPAASAGSAKRKKGSGEAMVPRPLGRVGRRRGPVPGIEMVAPVPGRSQSGEESDRDQPNAADSSCACGTPAAPAAPAAVSTPSESPDNVLVAVAAEAAAAGLRADAVLVDAHCHLQLDPLYARAASGEARAAAARSNVVLAVVCGTCPGSDWARVQELYEAEPSFVRPQFGLHPWWIQRHFNPSSPPLSTSASPPDAWVLELEERIASCPAAGVGECGLDKGVAQTVPLDAQEAILEQHVAVAGRHGRPVTIHCVGAWGRLLDSIKRLHTAHPQVRAFVLHSCNSMPPEMAASFASVPNVYFSFTGRALGAKETRLAHAVPLDRMLLETDSPDQLPTALRHRLAHNEPAALRLSCVLLSQVDTDESRPRVDVVPW